MESEEAKQLVSRVREWIRDMEAIENPVALALCDALDAAQERVRELEAKAEYLLRANSSLRADVERLDTEERD